MERIEPTINLSGEKSNHFIPQSYNFTFTGIGSEYFRIWIVNILLTILTLGIYSAWAKVRTKRYFYGNTHLAQSSFDYLADPITILKGRLIAVAILIVYIGVNSLAPVFQPIFFLVLIIFMPWLIVRSMAFNALNSAYRNIRFNFTGSVGTAIKEYIGYPILVFFSFGLMAPYIRFRQTRFTVDNHHFGDEKFKFTANISEYYMLAITLFIATISVTVFGFMSLANVDDFIDNPEIANVALLSYLPFIYLAFVIIGVYAQVKFHNLLFNNVTLANHRLQSSLKVGPMLWLLTSNLVGLLLTLGLFYPWAKVRMAKYYLEQLNLAATTDLNNFTATQTENISAAGDEIGEAFAVDVGF